MAAGDDTAIDVTVRLHKDLDVKLAALRFGINRVPFSAKERGILENLAGELKIACSIFVKNAGAERERRAYRKSLDRLGVGLLLVDSSTRLIATNGIGEELLQLGEIFTVVHGRVKLAIPAATCMLDKAILNATATQDDPNAQHGKPILIPRANGEAPLTAFVYPGPQPFGFAQPLLRTAVILVTEPGRKSGMTVEDVVPLFGLTRAEAALAIRLVDGETVTQASAGLGISRNTARTQLNTIFQKAGVVRQSELVRHLLNSAAICALTGADENLPSATGMRLPLDGLR